jgi:predicted nucleic acid-binding protein
MRVAVDTSAVLALASARDQYHARAASISQRLRAVGGRCVGTTLVLAELHGHFLRRADPPLARRILDGLLNDPMYEWCDCSVDLVRAANERWLAGYADQRFSLTDAVTFELMRQEKLTLAFAFDDDFRVAGFDLLK